MREIQIYVGETFLTKLWALLVLVGWLRREEIRQGYYVVTIKRIGFTEKGEMK